MLEKILNQFNLEKKKSPLEKQGFKPYELPLENGIKFVARDKQGELELILEKNSQEQENFKKYAPVGTKFIFSKKDDWSADNRDSTKPILRHGNFKTAWNLLDYMHEAGHLNNLELGEAARKAYYEYELKKAANVNRAGIKPWLKALRDKKQAYLAMELANWDFAVSRIKELEDRFQINLLNRMGSEEEIKKYIKKKIDSWKQGFIHDLGASTVLTEEQMDEHLGPWLDREEPRWEKDNWPWKWHKGKWIMPGDKRDEPDDSRPESNI